MNPSRYSDDDLARMLRARAVRVGPSGIHEDIVAAIQRERAGGTALRTRSRPSRGVLLMAAALVIGAGLVGSLATGSAPTLPRMPSVARASVGPVAGRVACGYHDGKSTFATASLDAVTAKVLGCSRDGTLILIQKGRENLFVVHTDGSETQVTEQLSGFDAIDGSGRPSGATISPDGSRVVFAGLTTRRAEWRFCHDGALFAVDADGGPAEVLFESRVPQNGIVRDPMFSPDGTRIAFADGYCDSTHSVWVMNADGTDARQILVLEGEGLGAGHVNGLAWSPAGDRIALIYEGRSYTFAADGSDLRLHYGTEEYCWPGVQC